MIKYILEHPLGHTTRAYKSYDEALKAQMQRIRDANEPWEIRKVRWATINEIFNKK